MGLLTRVASMFGRSPAAHERTRSPARSPASTLGDSPVGLESDPSENGEGPFDGPLVEVMPVSVRNTPAPTPRRSRQEMMDELEQNYREVLEIVRKFDGHLDKADERAQRMADIADRMLEAAERIPAAINENAAERHAEQIELLRAISESGREGSERVEQALVRLGVQHEVASQSHEQLVTSMADFRETMSDVGRTNRRTAEALETGNRQKQESDERLSAIIVGNQRWMIGILAASMLLAAAALMVAVVAVTRGG